MSNSFAVDSDHTAVRQDEKTGLRALFENVFFDVPFSADAISALSRTRFRVRSADDKEARPGAAVSAQGPAEEMLSSPARTILLYRGESGIGKTRIFREFRKYAEERRIPVYEIHCYDVEGIPLKPFLRVMREILRDFEFGDLLREKYRPGLSGLLPELFQEADSERPEGGLDPVEVEIPRIEEEKLRVFDGITQLLFEVTALSPLVILVHDLNWGDQATIELLRFIGRNAQLRQARQESPPSPREPAIADLDWMASDAIGDDADASGADASAPPAREGRLPDRDSRRLRSEREASRSRGAGRGGIEKTPARLMILANYQGSASEDGYLERALRSLGSETFVYHAEIRRLAIDETRAILKHALGPAGSDFEPEAVERIHEYSEGFPSYIHELLRLITRKPGKARLDAATVESAAGAKGGGPAPGTAETPEGAAAGTPAADRRRILRLRLLNASDEELLVLQALSMARKPLTTPWIARVLERPEDAVQRILDRLEAEHFIERVGQLFPRSSEEDGYYFRIWDYPDVVGETLRDPEERAAYHQRIGEEVQKLEALSGDEKSFEVFYHLRRGLDARGAIPSGVRAARRFARAFSVEKATLLLDDLLSLLDRKDDLDLRLEILKLKMGYHLALKDYGRAEEVLKRILDGHGESLGATERAELHLREAEIHRLAGDTNKALKALTRALKHIPEVQSPLGAHWHLSIARVRKDRQDVKRATNLCLKGVKICQKCLAEADAAVDDKLRARAAGGAEPWTPSDERELEGYLGELYQVLAQTFILKGDYVHAVENFRRSLEVFEGLGDERAATQVLDDLGTVYLEEGSYFRAARYFYRALEIKRRHQDIAGLCNSYDQLGMVYLRTGDELKTIAHLNQSIHLKEKIGDIQGLNPTLGVMGELYARLGRYSRALSYFDWEIQNSEAIKDTCGLVDAFIRKGWLFLELGELKQVEDLTRQTGILASEFKLAFQEANGARLAGVNETLKRRWNEAETQLKKAQEIFAKLGNRRQEAKVLLDQAELKFQRETFDDALKLASKALVLSEQLQALDLQVRAHNIKGNIFRFLKGGSLEKAKEHLRKALDLGKSLNDVHLLFDIDYSLAKVFHYDREFIEAGNYYGKAEAILRRITDELPGELAARYFEDPRRRQFLGDANRFRREVEGRTTPASDLDVKGAGLVGESGSRGLSVADYEKLQARLLRVGLAQNRDDFHQIVLREALDLMSAERGFVLRVRNRQFSAEAHHGFSEDPETHADFPSAQSIAEESMRKGKVLHIVSGSEPEKSDGIAAPRGIHQRCLVAVPLRTPERIFGALYLDRPANLGPFSPGDQGLLEALSAHVAVHLEHRRGLEVAIREPLTGLYASAYFLDRLTESYRLFNLHGRPFLIVGFYLPTLESSMDDDASIVGAQLAKELHEELPESAIASWSSPILAVLVRDGDLAATDRLAQRVEARLIAMVNSQVPYQILAPEARLPNGIALYHELRRKLLPAASDQHTLMEIRQLLSREITLKDAKLVLEKHIIENTLRKTGGNITHAARELGIHRPQLSSLLKKHDLKRERFEQGVELEASGGRLGIEDGDEDN